MELYQYVRIKRRKVWLLLSLVVFCCSLAAVYSYVWIQPLYQANTKLIVNQSSSSLASDPLDINAVNLNIRLINSYKEIIRTLAIMDVVSASYPQFQLSPDQLIGKVRVDSVNDTQVMTVTVTDPSYAKAAEIANAVSKVFQQEIPSIMAVDNVKILNEAQPLSSPGPINVNPVLHIGVTFIFAMMAGIGIIFLLAYLKNTVETEEDVARYMGLPVLVSVVQIKDSDRLPNASSIPRKAGESTYAAANQKI